MKFSRFFNCTIACAIVAIFSTQINAAVTFHGIINTDTKWTAQEGPYILDGDVLVAKRAHLSIGFGTKIIIKAQEKVLNSTIPQIDHTDSFMVAIKVKGSLSCEGIKNKRVTFIPPVQSALESGWFGIVLDSANDKLTEIAFAEIAGACHGIWIRGCSPRIRNSIMEFNNVGISINAGGNAKITNCVIASNLTAGIRLEAANPVISNSIIVYNRLNGIWCDGTSKITLTYSCLFGNSDGDFMECDSRFGALRAPAKPIFGKKTATSKTPSVDFANNMYTDPVFAGSASDSSATEHDVSLPTDRSRIADTSLARVISDHLPDSLASKKRTTQYKRYSLSRYSPCRSSGDPASPLKNSDGSRGDMGVFGGPEISGSGKK